MSCDYKITFTRDTIDSLVRIDERNKSIDRHEFPITVYKTNKQTKVQKFDELADFFL
jgi:hypothetical protein